MIARLCFESDAWQKLDQIGHKTSAASLLSQIGKVPSWGCLALLLLRIGNGKEIEENRGNATLEIVHVDAIFRRAYSWQNRICKKLGFIKVGF